MYTFTTPSDGDKTLRASEAVEMKLKQVTSNRGTFTFKANSVIPYLCPFIWKERNRSREIGWAAQPL